MASENGNGHQPAMGEVEADAVIRHLSQQLAGLHQQLAMRDAYIDRLHQALADVAAQQPSA